MRLQPATEPERAVARLRGMLPKPTGFLTPESLRPDPRLALRGVLGLMLPVLLGRVLDLPALDLVVSPPSCRPSATSPDRRSRNN